MSDVKQPVTVEQMAARNMADRLETVIGRFDDLRDTLRQIQDRVTSGDLRGEYADLAAEAQSAIVTALFNAGAHGLTRDAAAADLARQRRIAAEQIAAQIEAQAAEARRLGADTHADGVTHGAWIAREYAKKEG